MNSGNYVGEIGDDEEETEEETETFEEEEEGEEKKTKKIAPNYGKISKAISEMQATGVKIELPDINKAQADFIPDVTNNAIYYSLQAITVVSDDLFENIVAGRPYSSMFDFYERIHPTTAQMIGLIKAGCFDALEGKKRIVIMENFLQYLADKENPVKEKLTTVQLKKAIALKMPELADYREGVRTYKYKAYLDSNCIHSDSTGKRYLIQDEDCIKFFNVYMKDLLNPVKDEYTITSHNGIYIKITALKRVVDQLMSPLMTWFNSEDGIRAYNELLKQEFINELRAKYCGGTLSKWEMDTMNFYYSGHELEKMCDSMYGVVDFNSLSENSSPKDIKAIAGTVINVINAKHTISILTKYGVVDVKFYGDNYIKFNKKISEIDAKTKKKRIIDDSWFKRGNKLLIYGTRREDTFIAKNCKVDTYYRSVGLIEGVNLDGSLEIRFTRTKK